MDFDDADFSVGHAHIVRKVERYWNVLHTYIPYMMINREMQRPSRVAQSLPILGHPFKVLIVLPT